MIFSRKNTSLCFRYCSSCQASTYIFTQKSSLFPTPLHKNSENLSNQSPRSVYLSTSPGIAFRTTFFSLLMLIFLLSANCPPFNMRLKCGVFLLLPNCPFFYTRLKCQIDTVSAHPDRHIYLHLYYTQFRYLSQESCVDVSFGKSEVSLVQKEKMPAPTLVVSK